MGRGFLPGKGFGLKRYSVLFDFCDYCCERVEVLADSKAMVRKIMKSQYGKEVIIRLIEEED